ncbi:MAG TPA: tetratricopeptide repeat protein, partial [Anaerolineae bacterium]|nr:tetratricopeptide repeat protein [Anaerolineae bacterium]
MDELQLGIQAAKSGDHAAARAHLVRAVQRDPNNETAWIWMAQVMDDPARRVDCLKQALRINPQNTLIQRAIQALTAAAPASSVSEPEPVAAVELEPEPETPWAAAPAWDAAASWAAEPSPEAEAAAEPESETPWAAAPAWDAAASWAAEPSSEAEAAAEPESETPWTAAPAWDAAASWAATSAAETEAEPESPWDLKPVWEEEAEAEPTAETPLWAPGTFETEEAEEESVAPATLWGLEPLNAGTSTEEEAPAAAAIWDFTSAWSDTADEEESALIPPWQGETAEDADAGWSLDTALGLSGESAPAEPEVASEAADEGTEWNFEQLWGEEEKIEVTPPELGAGAPPALEKEAPIAPAFILDDDLKQVLEGVPETPAPMAPAAPFTVPVTESAPPQRVSLLDRRRMSYFQPPAPAPELVAPGGAVELFDEEPAPESAPVAAVKEKRGRRAKQRSAKRTEEASVSAEAAPTSRRRFRLLDARTLIGIFGMLDVAIISALLIAFMTREVTKPPAARVAAQCAALDRTGFTLQTPWEVSGTLSASTVYTAGAKYLIRETLVISPEQRLLLEPGAQLVFEPGAGLEVYGALYACGTADAPVLLTSERQTPGSWAGIRFHGVGPDVWLSHAEIYFAGERALYLENSAPVLANVTIANSARFPISV